MSQRWRAMAVWLCLLICLLQITPSMQATTTTTNTTTTTIFRIACQLGEPTTEPACRDQTWKKAGHRCYKLFDETKSYVAANEACIAESSTLARIESENENTVAAGLLTANGEALIGYKDGKWFDNGVYYGDAACYNCNWQPKWHTTSYMAKCAVLMSDKDWDPIQCIQAKKFVCSYDQDGFIPYACPTTTTTTVRIDAAIERIEIDKENNETEIAVLYRGTMVTAASALNDTDIVHLTKFALRLSFNLSENSVAVVPVANKSAASRRLSSTLSWVLDFSLTVQPDQEPSISKKWATVQSNPEVLYLALLANSPTTLKFTSFGGLVPSTTTRYFGFNLNVNDYSETDHEWYYTTTTVSSTTPPTTAKPATTEKGATALDEFSMNANFDGVSVLTCLAVIFGAARNCRLA